MRPGRTVGVLGGMGPAATWDFCARLLTHTPGARDQDHPRVIVDCDPGVPDRNAAMAGKGPSPGPRLARMAAGLEAAGAELLCMPCNAAHAFADEVRAAARIPFIDMVDATAGEVRSRAPDATRVAVLATDATLRSGLYARALEARGIRIVPSDEDAQRDLMALIYAVKAGDVSPRARATMAALAADLVAAGAQAVVGACTEVPLLLADGDTSVPLVASTEALAKAVAQVATRTTVP